MRAVSAFEVTITSNFAPARSAKQMTTLPERVGVRQLALIETGRPGGELTASGLTLAVSHCAATKWAVVLSFSSFT